MKKFLCVFAAFACLFTFAACDLENQASDSGLNPGNIFGTSSGPVEVQSLIKSAHACCEQRPAEGNNGPAEWAIDGNTGHWWRSNYTANSEGYNIDTRTTGHVNDMTNYLMKGDANRVDGYTWTRDTALAAGGPGFPADVNTVVPQYGAHWLTMDLGKEVNAEAGKFLSFGYFRRGDNAIGGLGQPNVSYELYVSKKDFGWVVDNPAVIKIGTGTVANVGGAYVYSGVQLASSVTFRYVQIRWIFASTIAADSRIASAADIVFKIVTNGGEPDYTYIMAVYLWGKEYHSTMPPGTREFFILNQMLDGLFTGEKTTNTDGQNFTVIPGREAVIPFPGWVPGSNLSEVLRIQFILDGRADDILKYIYRIDPPKKPPEVTL